MRLADRNLHRLLALVAFGLYVVYLIRATTSKGPLKLKSEHATNSNAMHNSPNGDVSKVVNEHQLISTELISTIKKRSTPAEVFKYCNT